MTVFHRSKSIALALCSALLLASISASVAGAQASGTAGQLSAGKMMPLFAVNNTANTVTVGHTTFTVTASSRFYDADGNLIRMSDLNPIVGGGPGSLLMATTESRVVGSGRELISLKVVSHLAD